MVDEPKPVLTEITEAEFRAVMIRNKSDLMDKIKEANKDYAAEYDALNERYVSILATEAKISAMSSGYNFRFYYSDNGGVTYKAKPRQPAGFRT